MSFFSDAWHSVSDPVANVLNDAGDSLRGVESAFNSVVKGVDSTFRSIKEHPLQVIAMAAIAYATAGLGTLAAEGLLAGDAIAVAAGEGAISLGSGAANAAMFTAIQTAVPAAIAGASVTAINGGSISEIATSGIIAGVTAGATAGLSSSQIIQNLTTGLDPSIVQALTSATGQSIGGAVNAVLQGKDPFTGAVSGAVSGALSSALSQSQIADLSQTAAKMLGSTVSAGVNAAIRGGNVGESIGNSLVYGAAKLGLNDAFNSVNSLQKNLTETVNNFTSTQEKAKTLSETVQQNQKDAEDLANNLNSAVKDYSTAKSNYETEIAKGSPDSTYLQQQVDTMNAAIKTYDDLLPEYKSTSDLLTDNFNNLQELSNQLTTLNTSANEQYAALQTASTDLTKEYSSFVDKLSGETQATTAIENRIAAMSPEAQTAYHAAISNGQTATDALATASQIQSHLVQTEEQPTTNIAQTNTVAQDNTKVSSTFTQPTADLTSAIDNGDGTTTEVFADGTRQIVNSLNGTILSQTLPSENADVAKDIDSNPITTTAVVIGVDPVNNQASVIDTNGNVTTIAADNVNNGDVVNLDSNNNVVSASSGTEGIDLGQVASADTADTTTDTQLPNTVQLLDSNIIANNPNSQVNLEAINDENTDQTNLDNETDIGTETELTPEEQYNKLMLEPNMDSATASELSGYTPPNADTGNVATDTGNVATDTGNVATDTGNVATDTGNVATDTGNVATDTGIVIRVADPNGSRPLDDQGTLMPGWSQNSDGSYSFDESSITSVSGYSGDAGNIGSTIPIKISLPTTSPVSTTTSPVSPVSPTAPPVSPSTNKLAYSDPKFTLPPAKRQFDTALGTLWDPAGHLKAQNSILNQKMNPYANFDIMSQEITDPQLAMSLNMAQGGLTAAFATGGSTSAELPHIPEFYSEGGMKHAYVRGDGDGTSDEVKAMLARGEFVIPADVVSNLGNGDNEAGAEVLDKFLQAIREHKRSTAPDKLPPDSKGPLTYLSEAYKKVKES